MNEQRYRSYLIRCWLSAESRGDSSAVERLILETVSNEPQRWGFSTVDDLMAFLRVLLLERETPRPPVRTIDQHDSQEYGKGGTNAQ